jgi:hypothetical protein
LPAFIELQLRGLLHEEVNRPFMSNTTTSG